MIYFRLYTISKSLEIDDVNRNLVQHSDKYYAIAVNLEIKVRIGKKPQIKIKIAIKNYKFIYDKFTKQKVYKKIVIISVSKLDKSKDISKTAIICPL